MKLYATVKSERATVGQGGNEYIVSKFQNKDRKIFFQVNIHADYPTKNKATITCIDWEKGERVYEKVISLPKGEKQKGELDKSGQNCIYQHNHSENGGRNCTWYD